MKTEKNKSMNAASQAKTAMTGKETEIPFTSVKNAFLLIFRAAENRGVRIRRYSSDHEIHEKEVQAEGNMIRHALETLDSNCVAFDIQNQALHRFNNVEDQAVWEVFFRLNHEREAEILAAASVNR